MSFVSCSWKDGGWTSTSILTTISLFHGWSCFENKSWWAWLRSISCMLYSFAFRSRALGSSIIFCSWHLQMLVSAHKHWLLSLSRWSFASQLLIWRQVSFGTRTESDPSLPWMEQFIFRHHFFEFIFLILFSFFLLQFCLKFLPFP